MCRGRRAFIDRPVTSKSGAFAIPWQDFPLHLLAAIPAVCTAFSFAGSPYEKARITFAGPNTCQSCLKNWAGIRDFRSGGYFKCRAWNRTVVVERPTAAGELAHTGSPRLDPETALQLFEPLVVLGLQADLAVGVGVAQGLHVLQGGIGEPLGDCHAVGRDKEPVDVVSGLDAAGPDHAEVGAHPAGLGEPLDPVRLAHPPLEGGAGDARGGDFHLDVQSDLPPFADHGVGGVEARDPQVFAEDARWHVPAEFAGPVVGVVLRVRVECLVFAAVVDPARLDIAAQAKFVDFHRSVHGALVDRGDPDAAGIIEQLVNPADSKHGCGFHGTSVGLRRARGPGLSAGMLPARPPLTRDALSIAPDPVAG